MNAHADTANEATTAETAARKFEIAIAAHNIETAYKRKQLITEFLAGLSEQEQLEMMEDPGTFDLVEALAYSPYASVREAIVNSINYGATVTIANRDDIPEDEATEALEVVTRAAFKEPSDVLEDLDRVLNGNHGYGRSHLDAVATYKPELKAVVEELNA